MYCAELADYAHARVQDIMEEAERDHLAVQALGHGRTLRSVLAHGLHQLAAHLDDAELRDLVTAKSAV